ncbi:MAG: DivIVA domain-containing protein [Ruminococcaceae bacterium]|nr:DivIVA domain-containing protein [Oscillospiraceae bacterium]
MFTPQQLQQISFDKAVFGGYDMDSVDEVLEPLLEDYETLYRENATLKSKMRVLVEKLEEYRKNESSVKEALRAAQRTCDSMVREAEKKCLDMLKAAKAQGGVVPAPVVDESKLKAVQAATLESVAQMEAQIRAMSQTLAQLKTTAAQPATADGGKAEEDVAREIAENLERIVGTAEEEAPVAPRPATAHSETKVATQSSRFADLDLQFGKNYDPTKR